MLNDIQYPIIKKDYQGEYDIQTKMLDKQISDLDDEELPDIAKIMNYLEYEKYCKDCELEQKYDDKNQNYIVFTYSSMGAVSIDVRLAAIESSDDNINLYIWDSPHGVTANITAYTIIIPTNEKDKNVTYTTCYTNDEYKNIKKYGITRNPEIICDKPVIYLYPEEEMDVSVKLGNSNLLTTSYPKYEKEWNVKAYPGGNLFYEKTNRNLYCLYYESIAAVNFDVTDEGFVVKGTDVAKFLEDKLSILGLNERETEEFIIYWLPRLENNEYNYIKFATSEEIKENMPIIVNPTPDSTIRVLMLFKGIDTTINVNEQQLEKVERNGFSFVEWGGVEIK